MRLTVIVLIALTACANYGVVDTWRGRSADELAVAWGSPSSAQRLDDGRRVVNYEHVSAYMGISYHCRAWFVVDAAGRIVKTDVAGDNGGCNRMLRDKPAAR